MRDSAAILTYTVREVGKDVLGVMTRGVGRMNQDDSIAAQGEGQNRHHQNSWHAAK
jgi:hypothetical protein